MAVLIHRVVQKESTYASEEACSHKVGDGAADAVYVHLSFVIVTHYMCHQNDIERVLNSA